MAPAASALWTETEISLLIQAWAEMDAMYPSTRCKRGTGTYLRKLHALFLRRTAVPRTTGGLKHMQYALRDFVLFVHQFDLDRKQDGGHLWFDMDETQRERYRAAVPFKSRGLTSVLGRETFSRLMQMERAQKWIGAEPDNGETTAPPSPPEASSSGEPDQSSASPRLAFSPHLEVEASDAVALDAPEPQEQPSTPKGTQGPKAQPKAAATSVKPKQPKKRKKRRKQYKHRDCNILLESMMELQNKQMRQAFSKLRADVEAEVRRSSGMLKSIISNQLDDPSGGDVAFVTSMLNKQSTKVKARFDQFEEHRTSAEAANRALVGQRF